MMDAEGATAQSSLPSNSVSDDTDQSLSHAEAMAKVKEDLADIIQNDPLLCDLPPEITLDEINSQIALEYGQAMVVNVRRADDQVMGKTVDLLKAAEICDTVYKKGTIGVKVAVVVTQNATVLDLKHAIKRHFLLKQSREDGKTHLSWYNIRNKDEVTFVKRLKER